MRVLPALGLAVLLAGCTSFGHMRLKPGASTAEVLSAMGAPATEFANPDGSRQLVYPKGPMGTQTYMVHLDQGGTLTRLDQVLNDDQFQRIQVGLASDQVRRMIGPPYRVIRFDNLKQDAWDYRYSDSWGYLCDFSVMIDDRGRVAGKVITRLNAGRDSGGFR